MIEWCNTNAGFIAALQTLATVFLSIVAIAVTAYVAWLPYKKELRIYSVLNYDKDGDYTMELYLHNSGNAALYIKDIQLMRELPDGTTDLLALGGWSSYNESEKSFLAPGAAKSFWVRMVNCNAEDEKGDSLIKIEVETETKTFVKKVDWAVG